MADAILQIVYQLSRWKDGSASWTGSLKMTEDEFKQAQESKDYIYTTRKPEASDIGRDGRIINIAKYIPEMTRREHQYQAENAGGALAQMMKEIISEQKAFLREKGVEDLSSLNEEEKRALQEEWIKVRSDYDTHKNLVRQALSEGKHVPAEVLKDYPALQVTAMQIDKGMVDAIKKGDAWVADNMDIWSTPEGIEARAELEKEGKWWGGEAKEAGREKTGIGRAKIKEKIAPVKMSREDAFKLAREARANKALEVKIRHNGVVKTRRQFIEDTLGLGYTITIKESVDQKARTKAFETIKSIRYNGEHNIRAKELAEALVITENPPKLKNYRLVNKEGSIYPISKTEYVYAAKRAGIKTPEIETGVENTHEEIGNRL